MPALAPARRPSALYDRFASLYDAIYWLGLQPGRDRAIARLALRSGERVLEVGVGTGLSALQYPPDCEVVAIDLSAEMLERARARLSSRRVTQVRLCRMDGSRLAFRDGQFDAVYAPYFINTVPDAATVAAEMTRVCRPGGRMVFLNHFDSAAHQSNVLNGLVGGVATRISGVSWDINLSALVRPLPLTVLSVEPVNLMGVTSVVLCRKR